MQQDLQSALLVFFILVAGLFAGAFLFFRNWLNSRDPDNQTLRAIFCLELKEEPKLYVAKTPVDDDLETARRKTLFSHFENLTGGLKSPFAKTPSSNATVSPEVLRAIGFDARRNRTINLAHMNRPHVYPTILPQKAFTPTTLAVQTDRSERPRRYST
uniref:Uncharacterized protein n=1 Tax=Panagrolaimus sp. JU765 TaxID=591449 RepID=A0AC34RNX0_9BILA